MKIENFKMRVTPEQSKRVQEVCGVSHDWKADYIIWYGNEMKFCITRDHFDTHPHVEITYDEFMAKYAPETKPQLNPAHLAIAFRTFGPYYDVEDIAKIVNIVLGNVELFEKLEGLKNELNR